MTIRTGSKSVSVPVYNSVTPTPTGEQHEPSFSPFVRPIDISDQAVVDI